MIGRSNNRTFIEKYPSSKRLPNNYRPFWLPASNFYMLAAAAAVAGFFIAWAILNSGEEDMPLVSAGLLASMILAGAVVLREVIFRSARYKLLLAQERIDRNIKNVQRANPNFQQLDKLTIEKNSRLLREIEKSSVAANGADKTSESHWQVFELCHDYLLQNDKELKLIGLGSPRLNILRESREKVLKLHKHHLLKWSSLESRALVREARAGATISGKLENANKALMILDSAMEFYPGEPELLSSAAAIKNFSANIKVSHWIEQAERAAFKKNYKRAISHYRDALFYLARDNEKDEETDSIAQRINNEIDKLRKVS